MSRPLMTVGALCILFESLLHAVLSPLIPHFRWSLGLSAAEVGGVVSAYFAGGLIGAGQSGRVVERLGARAATVVSLGGLGVATATFGLVADPLALVAVRAIQGCCGLLCWSAILVWLTEDSPRSGRGLVAGSALAVGYVGAAIGPIVGAVAVAGDVRLSFAIIGAVELAVAGWAWRLKGGRRVAVRAPLPLRAVAGSRLLRLAGALVIFTGAMQGALLVLVPLRADALGASAALIAVVFSVAAVPQAITSSLTGRWTQRRDMVTPLRLALPTIAAISLFLSFLGTLTVLIVLLIAAWALFSCVFVPGVALAVEAAEERGLDSARAWATVNFVWLLGLLIGAVVTGALAEALGLALPFVVIGAVTLAVCFAMLPRLSEQVRRDLIPERA